MKNLIIIFLILISTNLAFGQDELEYIPITTYDYTASSTEDLRQLDEYFVGRKVIGLGESTHGTSEFTKMRLRIFRYLVEEHDFNTFFLEEDYATCLRADNYIKGADDTAKDVVQSFNQWPWYTEEMVSVIEWMRDYNSVHQDNQLSFIGVDLQYYKRTLDTIDSLLISNSPQLKSKFTTTEITDQDFMAKSDTVGMWKFEKILKERKKATAKTELSKGDKNALENLLRGLRFIMEEKNNLDYAAYRDLKMAENIRAHLQQEPKAKGIFWAANAHIINGCGNKRKGNCRTGANLRNWMGRDYFAIALDFDKGSFNAYYLSDTDGNKDDVNSYTRGKVSVDPAVEGSIAARMRNTSDSILFIPNESFERRSDRKLSGRYVGAKFTNYSKTGSQTYFENWYNRSYDAIILIKNTSPTHFLEVKE